MDSARRLLACGAVLVAKDGQALLNKGYGLANRELDVPNTSRGDLPRPALAGLHRELLSIH